MNMSAKKKIKGETLRQYMESCPDGVGIQNAVAMLLGVALQLRDMHNDGSAHLQVSPDSIFISDHGAILRSAIASETDRYTSGYAAPEIYKGASAGNRSDIYSFCAVLSFAATGKHPENALARADSVAAEEAAAYPDPAFAQIIRTGMELDAEKRYVSMQELILKLSAYNVRPFVLQPEKKEPRERKELTLPQIRVPKISLPKIAVSKIKFPQALHDQIMKLKQWVWKRGFTPKKLAFIAAAVLPMVLVCIYAACYNGAKNHAQEGDFTAAERLLVAPAVTKRHDPQLLTYLDGLKLLEEGNYQEASGTFETISGYLNADALAQEADFRQVQAYVQKNEFENAITLMEQLQLDGFEGTDYGLDDLHFEFALWCAQEKDFENALKIMTQLQETSYPGADYKICEFHYSRGMYLLDELQDYEGAYEAFSTAAKLDYAGAAEMKRETIYREAIALIAEKEYVEAYKKLKEIPAYRDVDSSIKTLKENMYQLAQRHYRSGEFDLAKPYFTALNPYEDSGKYLDLINAHNAESGSFYFSGFMLRQTMEDLTDIFYFEDTASLLLSREILAREFLRGTWKGDGYYFTMEEDNGISYNLPRVDFGDTYTISDGIVLLHEEGNERSAVPLFYIEAVSPDCISVLCAKNSCSYMLYRQ